MRSRNRILACAMALALTGCANFKSVTEFAGETTKMTRTVRQEVKQLTQLCHDAADVRVLLAESTPTGDVPAANALKTSCSLTGDATVAFQEVTIDTLDLYAKTLLAMVDDKQFEVQGSIEGTTKKLASLKDKDGAPVVSSAKVTAVGSVLALLADVIVKAQREEGIRRLVAAGPSLADNARVLRGFFVKESQQSDYDGWLTTTGLISRGSEVSVALGKPMAVAEPIRAAELRRQLAATRKLIDQRSTKAGAPGEVPAKIVAALDAWIASIPVFQEEALKPDFKALRSQLKHFREKTSEARDAIEAGF